MEKLTKFIAARENGTTPNGNSMNSRWVVRDRQTGDFIEVDQYRNDLAYRYKDNIEFVGS
jgi:hypothetical protein